MKFELIKLVSIFLILLISALGCATKDQRTESIVEESQQYKFDTGELSSPESFSSKLGTEAIMYAHFINVGQGDSTLLEFPCGAILIDAGSQSNDHTQNLLTYLEDFFSNRPDLNNTIDTVIITHNHIDHTRALREVVESFNVINFIENGQRDEGRIVGDVDVIWLNENPRNINIEEVSQSEVQDDVGYSNNIIDPISCDNIDPIITILASDRTNDPGWDRNGDEFRNKNNHSIVIRVDFGESSFLFTGDLEEPAIETLVHEYSTSELLDVDVYQVGHHGSHNGTTDSLIQAMSPSIAIFSMSPWDDRQLWTAYAYGHPREDTVELLEAGITRQRTPKNVYIASGVRRFYNIEMNDAIFGTGWDGNIKIRVTEDGTFRVTTDN